MASDSRVSRSEDARAQETGSGSDERLDAADRRLRGGKGPASVDGGNGRSGPARGADAGAVMGPRTHCKRAC